VSKRGVIRYLANRRLYQACNRALDGVDAALAATRERTGGPGEDAESLRADGFDSLGISEFDPAMQVASAAVAYQMSRRTTAAIRQRSLTEFLR
jgi:hypothetical protein